MNLTRYVSNWLADIAAEANDEIMATLSLGHGLVFEIQDWEWLYPWLTVTDTELSMGVLTPAPGETLIINRNANFSSKTDISDLVRNSHDLEREGRVAPDATSPQVERTFLCDACRVEASLDLHNPSGVLRDLN